MRVAASSRLRLASRNWAKVSSDESKIVQGGIVGSSVADELILVKGCGERDRRLYEVVHVLHHCASCARRHSVQTLIASRSTYGRSSGRSALSVTKSTLRPSKSSI